MKRYTLFFVLPLILFNGLRYSMLQAGESIIEPRLVQESPFDETGGNNPNGLRNNRKNLIDSGDIYKPFQSKSPTTGEQLTGHGAPLPTLTLGSLEKDFRVAPDVIIAAAELEESLRLLDQKRAQSGLRFFGSSGLGAYREPVTDTLVRDFQRANINFGMRYPLLGKLAKEKIDILKTEATARDKQQEIELINQESLATLRTVYVNYWSSQRKIALCQAFLENEEEVEAILAHRTKAGYLLDGDRQEFLSAFALVRRNIANLRIIENRSLNVLRLLTRPDLTPFDPGTPQLPHPCLDENKLKKLILEFHPELIRIKKRIEDIQALQNVAKNLDYSADLRLVGSATKDLPDDEPGYGVSVHFDVEFPARMKKAKEAGRGFYQAALKKNQRLLEYRSLSLWQNTVDDLNRFQASLENIDFATIRLKASMESVRERLLRSAYLEGDTIEQLQKSRYAYYQSAMDYIDAETNHLINHVALLRYSTTDCNPINKNATLYDKLSGNDHPSSSGTDVNNTTLVLYRSLTSRQSPQSKLNMSISANSNDQAFTIQVGAYQIKKNAQALKQQLESTKLTSWIQTVDLLDIGRIFRLQLGQFSSKPEAEYWVDRLVSVYNQQAFIVPLRY